jgi:Fe2+ transport system protein FeoA
MTAMATKLIHFGIDRCARVEVLLSAGFAVDPCDASIRRLKNALQQSALGGVVVEEYGASAAEVEEAVFLSRSLTPAPLILFEDANAMFNTSPFDLVIPSLTRPSDWLREITQVIERSCQILQQTQESRGQSALMREQSTAVRKASALECERARRERIEAEEWFGMSLNRGTPGRQSRPRFLHRRHDSSVGYVSVCFSCGSTVAMALVEEDLEQVEQIHVCVQSTGLPHPT